MSGAAGVVGEVGAAGRVNRRHRGGERASLPRPLRRRERGRAAAADEGAGERDYSPRSLARRPSIFTPHPPTHFMSRLKHITVLG